MINHAPTDYTRIWRRGLIYQTRSYTTYNEGVFMEDRNELVQQRYMNLEKLRG